MIEDIVEELAEEIIEEIVRDLLVIEPGKLEIAYAVDGQGGGVPVILVHGLGQTIADWPEAFIDGLVAQGLRPVRLDNRDVGRSTRFEQHGRPPLLLQSLGSAIGLSRLVAPPYTLEAMASDVLALMNGLGIGQAHLVGVSMGGMIVQRLAVAAPHRFRSMTCIMSSSGAPSLPHPREDVAAALSASRFVTAAGMLAFRRLVAGPLDAVDERELAERVKASFAYGSPQGSGIERQYAAILADAQRHRLLAGIKVPSLIIHGEDDPFVRPEHGIDLADRIPGAERLLVPRMGHEITESFAYPLAEKVGSHIRAHSLS